jgi:hypothetical protein
LDFAKRVGQQRIKILANLLTILTALSSTHSFLVIGKNRQMIDFRNYKDLMQA